MSSRFLGLCAQSGGERITIRQNTMGTPCCRRRHRIEPMPDKALDPVEWELVRADIAMEKARLKANGDWSKWEEFQTQTNARLAAYTERPLTKTIPTNIKIIYLSMTLLMLTVFIATGDAATSGMPS